MANQLKITIYKIVDKKYYIGYNKVLLNICVKPCFLMRFSLKRHKNGKKYYPKIFATLSAAFFRISSV